MIENKRVEIRTCDLCGKKVSDNVEIRFGGSAFSGWFHVSKTCGSTAIQEMNRKAETDFCSVSCLKTFAESHMVS